MIYLKKKRKKFSYFNGLAELVKKQFYRIGGKQGDIQSFFYVGVDVCIENICTWIYRYWYTKSVYTHKYIHTDFGYFKL